MPKASPCFRFWKYLSRLLILPGIFCLTSCFDTREELWLNADSSGSIRIQASVPAAAAKLYGGEAGVKKIIKRNVTAISAFTSHSLKTKLESDQLHIDLTLTFSNALDLIEATSPPATLNLPPGAGEFLGTTEINFSGLTLGFQRKVNLPQAFPLARLIPSKQLTGRTLTTIIHLPGPATSHNATFTADGNRTLIWVTPLATALEKPMLTAFTMPLPIPWILVSSVTLLLVLLCAMLIYYIRRRKRTAE
ncbi:MAG: hypothetical protein H7Y36_07310 [Armatimonadetes bacterium]|nr:hypothetical protein [Akkermansiaceae bacterium]